MLFSDPLMTVLLLLTGITFPKSRRAGREPSYGKRRERTEGSDTAMAAPCVRRSIPGIQRDYDNGDEATLEKLMRALHNK